MLALFSMRMFEGARRKQRYHSKGKESNRRHTSSMNFQRSPRSLHTDFLWQGLSSQPDENPPALPRQTYDSPSQSFPALGWLLFPHWDLLCEDASPLDSFYILVINLGLSFSSFISAHPCHPVSYLYLINFLPCLCFCLVVAVLSKLLMEPYYLLLLFCFSFPCIRAVTVFLPI